MTFYRHHDKYWKKVLARLDVIMVDEKSDKNKQEGWTKFFRLK